VDSGGKEIVLTGGTALGLTLKSGSELDVSSPSRLFAFIVGNVQLN